MLYSQFYFKDKTKIPIPLTAIVIVIVAAALGSFFLKREPVSLRASKKNVKRVEVTNLSPVQAVVFWQSEEKEDGFLLYGENPGNIQAIALDDRDVAAKKNQYFNHYITLRNLKKSQSYFFKLVSGRQVIVKPDGTPYSFKTPAAGAAASVLSPAHGSVLKENLNAEENALVLLYVDNFYPLSTITKSSGEWLIPLNSFFDVSSLESNVPAESQPARIEIISEDNKNSVISGRLNQLSPVKETIIIGKNYDLSRENNVLSATTASGSTSQKHIDIIYPVESSLIPGSTPLIKGVALPNRQVFITVNSPKTFSAVVTTDAKGNWSYLLPDDLELGQHVITIRTSDQNGQETTLTRRFTIINNDNAGRVLGEASGSPTIAVSPTSTPAPINSVYPTVSASLTPTIPVAGIIDFIPVLGGLFFVIAGLGIILVF